MSHSGDSAGTPVNIHAGVTAQNAANPPTYTAPIQPGGNNAGECIAVVFHLYVKDDASVVQLEWQTPSPNEEPMILLEAVGGNPKHWQSKEIPIPVNKIDQIGYRYQVLYKEGFGRRLINTITWSKQEPIIEQGWRSLQTAGTHRYDIFRDPEKRDRFHTIFTGQFFFVKMLYSSVRNGFNLKELLIECEHVHFGHPSFNYRDVDEFKYWVWDNLRPDLKDCQGAFLCALLAQFLNRLKRETLWSFLCPAHADYLLKSLAQCSKDELPASALKNIKEISWYLLQRGTNFDCLSYIACFGNLLEARYTIQEAERLPNPHTEKHFNQVAADALVRLGMLTSREDFERLTSFIISRVPSFDCLWVFYALLEPCKFGLTEAALAAFSRSFQVILSRPRRPILLDPTGVVWHSTPKGAMRKILADPFCEVLVEELKKECYMNQEKLEIMKTFVIDEDLQSSKHLPQIFEILSKSKYENFVDAMVDLLNDHRLASFWGKMSSQTKQRYCIDWMQSFCKCQPRSMTAPHKDSVLVYLRAFERISPSCAVKDDQALMPQLNKWVKSKLGAASLKLQMDAFQDVQTLSDGAQSIYMQQLQEKFQKEAGEGDVHTRLKKMVTVLISAQGSSGGKLRADGATEEILRWMLDLVKLPRVQEPRGWEETVKKMSKYPDLFWPFVLAALNDSSTLKKHPQLSTALEALTALKHGLDSGHIHVGFLYDLKNEEMRLLGRCCSLMEDGASFQEAEWAQRIQYARQRSLECGKIFSQLESTLKVLEELSNDVVSLTDLSSVFQDINARKQDFRRQLLADVANDDYWTSLLPLRAFGRQYPSLARSVVFANVASRCLHRETPGHENSTAEKTVGEILEILMGECVEEYRSTCNRLSGGSSELLVKDAEILFNGLEEKDLKEEVAIMAGFCSQSCSDCERMMSNYLKYPTLQRKAEQLLSAVKLFGCNIPQDSPALNELKQFALCCQMEGFTLAKLSRAVEKSKLSEKVFDKAMIDIVHTLGFASDLLKFLRDTAKEDIIVLIDAVEEHSDHFVSESVVSNLIDVHKFLRNVLLDVPSDPWDLARKLRRSYESLEKSRKSGMAAKIKLCSCNVHSLRGLYMNVANREEMTKEKISSALSRGRYQLGLKSGVWEATLSYHRQDDSSKVSSYGLNELLDLRSRALLIMNTDRKRDGLEDKAAPEKHVEQEADPPSGSLDLSEFVQQVDLISEILRMCEELHSYGHPDFKKFWKILDSTHDIKALADNLTKRVQDWENLLETVRKEYVHLNYFHADQLWVLSEFFGQKKKAVKLSRAAVDLLRFVDTSITPEDVEQFMALSPKRLKRTGGHEGNLRAVGQTLESFFKFWKSTHVPPVVSSESEAAVKPNELFVAVLEEGSSQTVHVVMSLFEHTTGLVPQPSQVLFCHSETTWEEIERLLRRAFLVENQPHAKRLHCLANVECLPNDMQFDLVAAIKRFQATVDSDYWLSLVCRGRQDHPIVDQFADCSHHIGGITEARMRDRLAHLCPDVCVVTSDLPGLGKTEFIHGDAAHKKKAVVSFPISGPLSRRDLVKRLSTVDVGHYECLHIDVGEVDDPLGLDTFLFELVVLGLATAGTRIYHIPTRCVYIEIANTLNHWLRDTLSLTKSFQRKDIVWSDFKDYVVSQEVSSPVQVVCHYLNAKETGTLESKDLLFTGAKKVPPLAVGPCRQLLAKYLSSICDLSFNIVESFINVFSQQLLKLSASPYFKVHNLKAMIGPEHDVRSRLLDALLEVSKEFAARSVSTCKAEQAKAIDEEQATVVLRSIQHGPLKTATEMVKRVENMIQWANNNHLLIVFHSLEALSLSVTALYRDVKEVRGSIKELFKSQAVSGHGSLEDFTIMTQEQLRERLERIACKSPCTEDLSYLGYALTPDNILKMALIIQRIHVNIPVIIMGETGCGKTSLVRYLAKTCGVPFHVFNFHAGIKEHQIVDFITRMDGEARKFQGKGSAIWLFLDEINTCDYLGTINEIICHHSVQGQRLSPNLVFVAACNPYRTREPGTTATAGLTSKTKADDECSKLVYRVHPLPETMIDYVWDYGSLEPADELAYIGRMVEGLYGNNYGSLLVPLLSASQEYIRGNSSCCVSLRDVRRCTVLMKWFHESLLARKKLKQKIPARTHLKKYQDISGTLHADVRSIILALAHCYQSRLPSTKSREVYRQKIAMVFNKNGFKKFAGSTFEAVVRVEQEEYLARMELPEGTAINAALRENVFVMLVCILNRIPVFVVGKPGCSKSLSMQVIRSNLRGKDAKDPFLKNLPQLYVVSFQGSKSSTSEGIEKVFEKARKYKSFNKTDDVLPVVLLDEIGLAEDSKHNPLKVLHSLLEPGEGKLPDVAVVGISNWALDPAKMNRANHLSRPEPDVKDLYDTGLSIRVAHYEESATRSGKAYKKSEGLSDNQLRSLAEAFHESQENQDRPNFHGLRDYYSLIKNLSAPKKDRSLGNDAGTTAASVIHRALQRNFGGLDDDCKIVQVFQQKNLDHDVAQEYRPVLVTDLIRDNLYDRTARHLMLITSGDSAIGILDQTLQGLDKENITIFGSRLEEDLSEDYSYRILSRIILCMERDCVLILRDLENIYGSLYDMLNQNYTVVGGRKNCRIALGPFSNPMCQVHDGFRCIVLVDHQTVEKADPPFLNRFEKQILRFSDVLDSEQHKLIERLQTWVTDISTSSVPEVAPHFDVRDMFVGFHEDTLPSLVQLHSKAVETDGEEEVVERCKQNLMWIASPDGVLRSLKSKLALKQVDEVTERYRTYFQKPIHDGLRHFLSELGGTAMEEDAIGAKLLVMTHSNVHTNVAECLNGLMTCQAEKLSSFKSEKQLTKQLQKFWDSPEVELLVLQCKPDLDASHMLLAKSIIEQQRADYASAVREIRKKHVCIIVHDQRARMESDTDTAHWEFNFLSGWRQVTVDVLEKPSFPITSILSVELTAVLNSESLPFEKVAIAQLHWCFMQIKYQAGGPSQVDSTLRLIQHMKASPLVMGCFKELTTRWFEENADSEEHRDDFLENLGVSTWQISVASNRQALCNSSTLADVLERYISHRVRQVLARIIFFLEKESAWPRWLRDGSEPDDAEAKLWVDLLLDKGVFNIDDVPEPQGADSYLVCRQATSLQYPFSHVFFEKIESKRELFLEEIAELQQQHDNLNEDGELKPRVVESLLHRFTSVIERSIPHILANIILTERILVYVDDLLDIESTDLAQTREQRLTFLKAACAEHVKIEGCARDVSLLLIQMHSIFWMEEAALNSALNLFVAAQACPLALEEMCEAFTASLEMKLQVQQVHEEPEERKGAAGALDVRDLRRRSEDELTTAQEEAAEEQRPDLAEMPTTQEDTAPEVLDPATGDVGAKLEDQVDVVHGNVSAAGEEQSIPESEVEEVLNGKSGEPPPAVGLLKGAEPSIEGGGVPKENLFESEYSLTPEGCDHQKDEGEGSTSDKTPATRDVSDQQCDQTIQEMSVLAAHFEPLEDGDHSAEEVGAHRDIPISSGLSEDAMTTADDGRNASHTGDDFSGKNVHVIPGDVERDLSVTCRVDGFEVVDVSSRPREESKHQEEESVSSPDDVPKNDYKPAPSHTSTPVLPTSDQDDPSGLLGGGVESGVHLDKECHSKDNVHLVHPGADQGEAAALEPVPGGISSDEQGGDGSQSGDEGEGEEQGKGAVRDKERPEVEEERGEHEEEEREDEGQGGEEEEQDRGGENEERDEQEEEQEELEEGGEEEGGELQEDEDEDEEEDGRQEDSCEKSEPSFEEALMNAVCVSMFPTQSVVRHFGDASSWSQVASLLLSTMSDMTSDVPSHYFLQVCNDYASLVLIPESLDAASLYALGSLGKLRSMSNSDEEDAYLDSQECFDQVCDLEESQSISGTFHDRFQEFLVLFFSRCIESNPDTPVRGQILNRIATSTDDAMLRFVGPVVHCILWTEAEMSADAFQEVLQNPDALQDPEAYPGLQDIDTALGEGIELDLPFVVMCCDLIGEVAFQDLDLTTVSGSDDPVLRHFRAAAKIVLGTGENQGVLQLLCATAYIRSMLSSVAKLVLENPSWLSQSGPFAMLLGDVNAIISEESSPHPRKSVIRAFLLKELRDKFPLYDLRNLCTKSENLSALKMLKWEENSVGKLSFDPLQNLTEKTTAETSLAKLLAEKEEQPMQDHLKTLKNDKQSMLRLAALLVKAFYLIRSTRPLKDTEDGAAAVVVDGLKGLPLPYQKLVGCIVGKEDFQLDELNITPESSPDEVHLAALVVHAGAILASHVKKSSSPFLSYFTNPLEVKADFVLAAAENESGYLTFRFHSPGTARLRMCHCSVVAEPGEAELDQCASCGYKYKPTAPGSEVGDLPDVSRGYVHQSIERMTSDVLYVRQLGPVEFRMLHLLVHAAVYVGYALRLFDDATLQKFMSTTDVPSKAHTLCLEHVKNDLEVLCRLLNVQQEEALHLLHRFLNVSTPLLTKDAKLTSEKSRLSWEKEFAQTASPLLLNTEASKWKLNRDDAFPVPGVSSSDSQENAEDDHASSDTHLAHLFRATDPNTFNSLRAFYLNSSDEVKRQHPLLGLFLDYHHILPQVAHLESLLEWNRIVDSRLSRRLSRKEAKKQIGDVIRGANDASDAKTWQAAFKKFKKAWKQVRPLMKTKLGTDQEIPHLSETSAIAYCLVERRGDGVFLCEAMEALLALQNEFVVKVLEIVSSGECAALSFWQKEGKSSVRVVHVQEATKKELIRYEWTDELLRFSQRDPQYGRGGHIFYDLRMIEKELAVRFLVEKAYLSTRDGMREFIFSKELFHICSDILEKLQQLIPQVCLTNEMRVGLTSVKKQSLTNVQELLEHLEIVLCLLMRIGGDPGKPLVEFTDSWLSDSRPFPNALLPEPRTAVQLRHVVSLYEFLEDQLAQSAAESVLDSYREPLIEDVKGQMSTQIDSLAKTGESITVDGIITALQRFMFRYMSSEEMRPHPGGDLLDSMMEPSLWPMESFKNRPPQHVVPLVIPSILTIGHVHSALSFYQDHKKSQARKRGVPSQASRAGSTQRAMPANRRKAKKFRRS